MSISTSWLLTLLFCATASADTIVKQLAGNARVDRDLPYADTREARQTLDLYRPAQAKGPLPVVVWIHGGGWTHGAKSPLPGVALLPYGYAVASINYRLSHQAQFPAQLHDCKAAIRFLRANASTYGLDPDRIAVWGHSAGGHLAALLGTTGDNKDLEGTVGKHLTQSSRVQAVIDVSGPSDLRNLDDRGPNQLVTRLLGKPAVAVPELAAAASPAAHAALGAAPHLLIHGENDDVVPVTSSIHYDKVLRAAGIESTLVRIPKEGHAFSLRTAIEQQQVVVEFLQKHLGQR